MATRFEAVASGGKVVHHSTFWLGTYLFSLNGSSLGRCLCDLPLKVFLLLPSFSPSSADLSPHFVDEAKELAKHVELSVSVHRRFGVPKLGGFLTIAYAVFDLMRNLDADVVYVRTFHLPELLILILAKMLGKKTVFLIQGTWIYEPPSLRNNFRRWIFKRAFYCADRIVLYSERMIRPLEKYVSFYNKQVRIVPNALEPSRFKVRGSNPRGPAPIILFVGRMSWSKGIHILVESATKVVKEIPDAQFLLIGNGSHYDYINKIKNLIGEKNLENNVRFLGPIPNNQLNQHYSRASVYAYPTLGQEGVTRSILEAMLFSLPVVATPDAGIPDIVIPNKTGLLVPKNNAEALAFAILKLLKEPLEARRMGENGRKLVLAKHTLEKTTPQLVSIFQEVI